MKSQLRCFCRIPVTELRFAVPGSYCYPGSCVSLPSWKNWRLLSPALCGMLPMKPSAVFLPVPGDGFLVIAALDFVFYPE